MLTTNVLGVFWGMKYQIRQMLSQDNPGGAIINLASIAGLVVSATRPTTLPPSMPWSV